MTKSPTPKSQPPTYKKRTCAGKFSYACKVWCMITVCVLLFAAAIALVYVLLTKKTNSPENIISLPKQSDWFPHCPSELLKPEERFDCYPDDAFVDKAGCESRGCCYLNNLVLRTDEESVNRTASNNVPTCVYPKNYGYISLGKATPTFNGFELPLRRLPAPFRYGDDIQVAYMKVEMQTKYRLRIKFYDPNNLRYEVPAPKVPVHPSAATTEQNGREIFLYSVTYDVLNKPFTLKVRRSSSDTIIFDTSAGALTLSNQFLELTTKVPSKNVYGLNKQDYEQYGSKFNWETFSFFSKKAKYKASPSVHPMYLCMENDGNAHGVLLLNSNAMEIQLHPSPAITFRTIGGVLDFYLFLGPTAEDVVQQYTEAVGRPSIPPYWALGFHVAHSSHSVDEIERFIDEFKAKHIPMETFILSHGAISRFGTKNKVSAFANFSSKLKSRNQKCIIEVETSILQEAVSNRDSLYNGNLQKYVFVTDKWGWNPIEGQMHEKTAVYPDFGTSEALTWWIKVLKKINSVITFDGLWLVNNEPTSLVDGSVSGCLIDDLNNPPYVPGTSAIGLYKSTLCMDALLHWKLDAVTHYDFHNLYGHISAMATEQVLAVDFPSERKLIISDSIFIGSGQFAGHKIKGLESDWEGLRSSVKAVLNLNLHGVAFSGTSKCEKNEELCLRWLQCSIFYPFLLLNNAGSEYLFNVGIDNKVFFHAIRNAISRRYELLPELYTLFYLAHARGSTVVRPLFHNYPNDNETYSITSQFMWGSSLLISPVLEKGVKELNFYLPEGIWYDYYQGGPVLSKGEWFTETGGIFEDNKQPAVLHIRSGHVITLQKPAETTTISRQNSMSILVALNATYEAEGMLYWDDGKTKNSLLKGEYLLVDYLATWNSLTVTGHFGKKVLKSSFYKAAIEQVRIMGLSKPPKRIIIDGGYILSNKQYRWDYDTMVLDLKLILIPLGRKTEIQWYY